MMSDILDFFLEDLGEIVIYIVAVIIALSIGAIIKMGKEKSKLSKHMAEKRPQAKKMAKDFIRQGTKSKRDAIIEIHNKTEIELKICKEIYEEAAKEV